MVSVKTLQESSGIYIRLMIEKSCGTTVRPAGKYFQGLIGICCHILSLLLYLKQYSDTKEKNIRAKMHTTASKIESHIKEGFHSNGVIKQNEAKISKYEKKLN